MPEPAMKMILMGTGPFAVPAFDAILQSSDSISLVITRPEVVSKSRKPAPESPVRQWAQSAGLPVEAPSSINAAEAITRVTSLGADLLVVCDYGQILSSAALEAARLGGINLHGSLLPAYRGAAPVQWAVWNGDAVTGVSVIHMTPRLDGGPLLASAQTPIDPDETAGDLEPRLSQIGVAPTLASIEMLRKWDGASTIGTPQDKSLVSKAPRLAKADGKIDWTLTNKQIRCQFNAMQPWPGAFTLADTGAKQPLRLVIRAMHVSDADVPAGCQPGQVVVRDQTLCVVTADGSMQLTRIQPAGKREMQAEEFLNGNPLPEKTVFG